MSDNDMKRVNFGELPITKSEDVEFSEELADEADKKAQQRAAEATTRGAILGGCEDDEFNNSCCISRWHRCS